MRAGARGRYFNTVDLVNRLEDEVRRGKADAPAAQLSRLDLVVLGVRDDVQTLDYERLMKSLEVLHADEAALDQLALAVDVVRRASVGGEQGMAA